MRFLSKGLIRKEDLARAKVQLKSQLLMHLEMKPVQFEDVSRQMLVYGQRRTPEEHAEQIGFFTDFFFEFIKFIWDRVEIDDIARIADTMLLNRPSLVCYGDLRWMPTLDQVRKMCER